MLRLRAHRYWIKYKKLIPEIIVIATLENRTKANDLCWNNGGSQFPSLYTDFASEWIFMRVWLLQQQHVATHVVHYNIHHEGM
jgi:hypothetical protein